MTIIATKYLNAFALVINMPIFCNKIMAISFILKIKVLLLNYGSIKIHHL